MNTKQFKISTSKEVESFMKVLDSEVKSVPESSHLATSEDLKAIKKALEK